MSFPMSFGVYLQNNTLQSTYKYLYYIKYDEIIYQCKRNVTLDTVFLMISRFKVM